MSHWVTYKCDACGAETKHAYGINLLIPPDEDPFRRIRADFDACSLDCLRTLVNRMLDDAATLASSSSGAGGFA